MDTSTVELVAALSRWAERAYQTCHREYMQSPDHAPLTEWAGQMTEQLLGLAGLLSRRLDAERARLAAVVDAAEWAARAAEAAWDAAEREIGPGRRAAHERLVRLEQRFVAACQERDDAAAALAAFDVPASHSGPGAGEGD